MINTILSALLGASLVFAATDREFYLVNGTKVETKVEALIAKLKDKNANVYRCQEQIVTSKGTLKNKASE
jgi:hypothetical protein